jgi:hypothetical protein
MRRILNQSAQAAVKKKGRHFQAEFRRLLPKLGYNGAIWAVAHRLCRLVWKILHEKVEYVEHDTELNPKAKRGVSEPSCERCASSASMSTSNP